MIFRGFVANRVLMPMINEAIYTVYEGVAEPEAVDQVMKLGMNHPMGPLQLADFMVWTPVCTSWRHYTKASETPSTVPAPY